MPADCKIFAENLEKSTFGSINTMIESPVFDGNTIRIMPDCHPGKGSVVGLSMIIRNDKICPGLIGPDIGCGMTYAKIKVKKHIEMDHLDKVVRELIPSGTKNRDKSGPFDDDIDLEQLACAESIDLEKAKRAIGTLGSGNHFIELDKDEEDDFYLVVHSGSRSLGYAIEEHYHNTADKLTLSDEVPHPYTYLEDSLRMMYIHDQEIGVEFAKLNRYAIMYTICKAMKWDIDWCISVPHNYIGHINLDGKLYYILRKGAIKAGKDDNVIIPLNMRDGCIIGVGKENVDWNCSAPHGAGRKYSRSDIAQHHTLNEFKSEMKGIYSTTVAKNTLDESPMAYKDSDYIKRLIEPTVEIQNIIRPVYNFKAGG